MSGHRMHLGAAYERLASWEMAADAVGTVPETDGPLFDGANLYLAAETLEKYWTAQADILRYGAAMHSAAEQARSRYEQAENVSAAYERAVDAAESFTRSKRFLQEAGSRLKEAAADVLLIERGCHPETARAMREADPDDL